LGGGRRTATDSIDHAVGIELLAAPGDVLPAGRPVLMIHARDTASAEAARSVLEDGLQGAIVEGRTPLPLVIGRLDSSNITNGNGVDQWDRWSVLRLRWRF